MPREVGARAPAPLARRTKEHDTMTTTVTIATTASGNRSHAVAELSARGEVATWAGTITVAASERGVTEVWLPDWHSGAPELPPARPLADGALTLIEAASPAAEHRLRAALTELAEYFAGRQRAFDVTLDLVGGPFSRRAWAEVARVPSGETRSYQEIAKALGAPTATRAVGAANGANPVPPFVPCHRIVGAAGRLTGYGPGLPLKQALLVFEDAIPASADDYPAWIERVRGRLGTGDVFIGVRALGTCCRPTCLRAVAHHLRPNRVFGTLEDATAAGFTPCPSCRPD
jgi:methylated-DNA-[protein]-cysteine S-methyltransferase